MYQYVYSILFFYSDEEPADEEDDDFQADDEDPDWEEDGDLGEGSGGRGRSPIRRRTDSPNGTSGNRGRGNRARGGRGSRARGNRARGGRGRGGRGRGGRARDTGANNSSNKSYDDPDIKNTLPPFQPSRPPGTHFETHVLRGGMTTELEFFRLFFTTEMIKSVFANTISYAFMRLVAGGFTSYTTGEGAWQTTTEDEINHLIALLIYSGLVRVDTAVEKYWSIKTLYHGLWARKILSRKRYKDLMAFLHVVDPPKRLLAINCARLRSFWHRSKSDAVCYTNHTRMLLWMNAWLSLNIGQGLGNT
jgi:hypothetical protein